MNLSKETSTLMRGYAILFIALHNFLHWSFIGENEMTFDINKSRLFFDSLRSPSWRLFGDFLSFIGWIGVAVFVFMSGYGLAKKYEGQNRIESKAYIKHSFLKLFFLMLPAVIFFVIDAAFAGNWARVGGSILSLTLLNNFICNIIPFEPGVYWYFGLTFQLYIIYLFTYNIKKINALAIIFCCIWLQLIFNPAWFPKQEVLSLLRHNFVGWTPQFMLGILCAKWTLPNFRKARIITPVLVLSTIVLILIMNLNYVLWLFVPFFAIVFFYSISMFSSEYKIMKRTGLWLGKNSSFIFVSHPIARKIACDITNIPYAMNFAIYLFLCFLAAILYKFLWHSMLKCRRERALID